MSEDLPNPTYSATVLEHQAGLRLDKFLSNGDHDLSRSRIKALIEGGNIQNEQGLSIKDPKRKVQMGESYLIVIPEAEEYEPAAQKIDLDIYYEDEHLLVLDKPAGMVVHPAAGNWDGTLVNALLYHCQGQLSGIGGVKRPGIVHRLDKETSGLMVVAKNDKAHTGLSKQFEDHSISRAYRAIVWGVPAEQEGRIEGNIGRSPHNRKKMAVVTKGGKTAATNYMVENRIGSHTSLVQCRLETGRTHQIRVHMSTNGHTVVGDALYGRTPSRFLKSLNSQKSEEFKCFSRHALHAFNLGFTHPITKEGLCFDSELPNDINDLISLLKIV